MLAALFAVAALVHPQDTAPPAAGPPATPVELGRVAWLRDLEEGLSASRTSGKPVLLLFQEVPG